MPLISPCLHHWIWPKIQIKLHYRTYVHFCSHREGLSRAPTETLYLQYKFSRYVDDRAHLKSQVQTSPLTSDHFPGRNAPLGKWPKPNDNQFCSNWPWCVWLHSSEQAQSSGHADQEEGLISGEASRITQKLLNRFPRNPVKGCVMTQERTHYMLGRIQINRWMVDFFFHFCLTWQYRYALSKRTSSCICLIL